MKTVLVFLLLLCIVGIIIGAVVEEVDNPTWEDTWKELGVRGLWSIAPFTLMFCIVFDTLIVVASLAALWALANIICFRIPKDEFDFLK